MKPIKLIGVTTVAVTIANTCWAINPDGTKGNAGPDSRQTYSRPIAAPRPKDKIAHKSGRPILENPSVEDVKSALGIDEAGTKNIADLESAGFGSFIEFETGSDTVIPSGGLKVIADALSDLEPDAAILIVGHTDNVGSHNYNIDLSQRRAYAVRRWLENNGVQPGAIKVDGAGETQPIDSNYTAEGRRRNRRVEFVRIYD